MKHIDPEELWQFILRRYPEASRREIAEMVLKKDRVPEYSTISHPMIQEVKTETVGSFLIVYFLRWWKPADPLILCIRRGRDSRTDGRPMYGHPGGYVNLGGIETAPEPLILAAAREWTEEVVRPNGEPVLDLFHMAEQILSARLWSVYSAIDARTPRLPSSNHVFAMRLTPEELRKLQEHSKLMLSKSYRDAVFQASNREVRDVLIIPLSVALELAERTIRAKFLPEDDQREYDSRQLRAANPFELMALRKLHCRRFLLWFF